jgi:sugar/nucleoside kinase (ribokinase family)
VCLGDVMLDVLVEAPAGLVPDDDTPARITVAAGGQAANVAAWVVALGGAAEVYGPRSTAGTGRLVLEALGERGVRVVGPEVDHPGAVVSLVTTEGRSLASDPGDGSWLAAVCPGSWLEGADWLFVSGYTLLRSQHPDRIAEVAAAARAAGVQVAVDLASAAMITTLGAAELDARCRALAPAVVLGNDAEWRALGSGAGAGTSAGTSAGTGDRVLKHGPRGATFWQGGTAVHRPPVPGAVVDATGAGDALAAGYLVGGVETAMRTAAACVAAVGAQPPVAAGKQAVR